MMNKDRLAVLIGKNGKTKEMIENLTHSIIEIDSETGIYSISPAVNKMMNDSDEESNEDFVNEILEKADLDEISLKNMSYEPSFSVWMAKTIVEAINIGFKPEKAIKLLDQEYSFESISIERAVGNSEKKNKRMIGRIIGDKGQMREAIEKFSRAYVSIYPRKRIIGLIGDYESLKIARKAIKMLLQGLPHHVPMNFLQKKEQERKTEEFRQTWKPSFD